MLRTSNITLTLCLFFLQISSYSFAKDRGITNTSSSPYVKLRSIDIDDVKWTHGFQNFFFNEEDFSLQKWVGSF